ncbi:MAG: amidohydrolase family protein [bacterium]|nr:amidohydrolase family protein [bacterium]
MIIDCHTHLSILDKGQTFESVARKMRADMVTNNIDGAIVIADNVQNDQCANTDIIMREFKGAENIWFVGSTSPFEPTDRIKPFRKLVQDKKIVAMKLFPGHDKIFLNDDRFLPDIELCDEMIIPLIIHTGVNSGDPEAAQYNDPKYIVEIARKYPNLSIVISHYFWPKMEYCFEMTDGLDNIYFDTSAMADPEVVEMSGGWDKVKSILEKTLKRRSGSVIFGTDYPMCDLPKHLQLIRELDIDEQTRQDILGLTSIKLFGLKI